MAENSGASAVTIHGRTRDEFYSGAADWNIIKNVKQTVNIPVIASGDILSRDSIADVKSLTGCDGVMIARGALGNPFIFSDKNYSKDEILDTALRHLSYIIECKGEMQGIKEARKHMCWYIKGMYGAAHTKLMINTSETKKQMENAINSLR
ncbi:MAG: tRNA-dihydrouridine synthase [Clostridia bacterium]|nr:tRNA-dihydrouridine synthase [Clostridia bacterium]